LGVPYTAQWIFRFHTTAETVSSHENLLKTLEVKGKSVPLQAWSGPEGSRKLTFPDF